ncbi:MAG: hypothetical protein C5B54_05335 [Acidobacteria bacterium]|nr:MAG: hypothetical protein C5B54_05335 [Acidobacteriota bacterium]
MNKHKIIPLMVFIASLIVAQRSFAEEALKLPPYKKVQLNNGMTLFFMEQHEIPIVSFHFIVKSGSTSDPMGKEGLASLTADMLRKGAGGKSADEISGELDFIGGQFGTGVDLDYSSGHAEFLKKDLTKGLELLTNILLHPSFPADEVTKMIKQDVEQIKSAKDDPENVMSYYFASYLYKGHPYGRPADGDEKSLPTITQNDVATFYSQHYTPDNTILAVVGDFNTAEMEAIMTKQFDAWSGKAASEPTPPEPKKATASRLLLVDKPDATQAYFHIGNVEVNRTNPDRVFIDVVNTVFGGRFTSRLNSALRVNSGLTYGAFSYFDEHKLPGPFVLLSYTENTTTEKAMDMALDVLHKLHEAGITNEELKSAKNYIKGQFPPEIETSDQLARLMTELEFYGLNEDEINGLYAKIDSMTQADAKRIIQNYFPSDQLVFVVVGKSAEIGSVVKKYSTQIDHKSISDPGF